MTPDRRGGEEAGGEEGAAGEGHRANPEGKKRKRFFVVSKTRLRHDEKKNQKTFIGWSSCIGRCPCAKRPGDVFWFFFSKKNFFLSFTVRPPHHANS
jgi:hypothetical protein